MEVAGVVLMNNLLLEDNNKCIWMVASFISSLLRTALVSSHWILGGSGFWLLLFNAKTACNKTYSQLNHGREQT